MACALCCQRHATPLCCTEGGGGELCKLEFVQFKFCAKFLYANCSVFLRICAGIQWALQAPAVSHEQLLGPHIISSLIFKKWHGFCRARICRFIFPPPHGISPPPPVCNAGAKWRVHT